MSAQPDWAPPPSAPEPADPAWPAFATVCRAIVDAEVRPLRNRYRRRANRHQFCYRLDGCRYGRCALDGHTMSTVFPVL